MTVEFLFIIAFILLAIELIVVSMGAFGIIAFIAFIYGLVLMQQHGMDDFYGLNFEIVAAIGFSIFVLFAVGGYYAFKAFGKKIETGIESMIGKSATVTQWAGRKGKIIFEGEDWRASASNTFKNGDTVIITGYKNLTLTVEKEK